MQVDLFRPGVSRETVPGVPTYVAFLRAINLGARRQFPKADIVAVTERAGGRDVETHINTGNVRLRSSLRSTSRVAEVLEAAYLADRGFDVPTVVLTPAELREVAGAAAGFAHEGRHYVELLRDIPDAELVADLEQSGGPGRAVHVTGRAVHFLVSDDVAAGTGALLPAALTRRLGVSTNRNASVIAQVATRWA